MLFLQKQLCALSLFVFVSQSYALGTLIPAPDRVDMVHDFKRNLVYISNGSQILRYDVSGAVMLAPFDIGGLLYGMDISPDGNTLAVADQVRSQTHVWIHTINLDTGVIDQIDFPRAFSEGGTFTVAYGGDGTLLITSDYDGSGWVPLRKYDQVTNTTTQLASVRQNSMIVSSGDLSNIALAESNISSGPFANYHVFTQTLNYGPGTNWFNYEIGVNYNGTQFSVPTYGGTFVYDETFSQLAVIGTYAGPQPIGVVYHPAENIVYYAWRGSNEVRAYDTQSLLQTDAYDFEYNFVHNGNHAFVNGRLKTAADGAYILATVDGGVRFLQLYDSLIAQSSSVDTLENQPVVVPMNAHVGNNGEINFVIVEPPVNGSLSGIAPQLLYTPNQDYNGTDRFTFQANYGKASVVASVDISISAVNSDPIAVDDIANLVRKKAIIAVLENDYDVDGDALSVVNVTQPVHGRTSILSDGRIYYRAKRGWVKSDSFMYTISDGNGGSATAKVIVNY